MKKLASAFFFFLIITGCLHAQSVYLPATHSVYKYLDKMEAKQVIVGYRDAVKPLSREVIARFIIQIDTTSMPLTQIEQEEQFYYKEEFFQELENIGYENIMHLFNRKCHKIQININLSVDWTIINKTS